MYAGHPGQSSWSSSQRGLPPPSADSGVELQSELWSSALILTSARAITKLSRCLIDCKTILKVYLSRRHGADSPESRVRCIRGAHWEGHLIYIDWRSRWRFCIEFEAHCLLYGCLRCKLSVHSLADSTLVMQKWVTKQSKEKSRKSKEAEHSFSPESCRKLAALFALFETLGCAHLIAEAVVTVTSCSIIMATSFSATSIHYQVRSPSCFHVNSNQQLGQNQHKDCTYFVSACALSAARCSEKCLISLTNS